MTAGLLETIVLATRLPEGRWAVLTLFIVLRPDYATTLGRTGERAFGTALGAGLGIGLVDFGHLGPLEMLTAAVVAIGAAYAIFSLSYILFSAFLTSFVVLLLDILGSPAASTVADRLLNTAIGGAVALAAFIAWPTWEGYGVNEKFARLFEAHAAYLSATLRGTIERCPDLGQLRALQLNARRARGDAEASAQRLQREEMPVVGWHKPTTGLSAGATTAISAAIRRLGVAELVLHALAETRCCIGQVYVVGRERDAVDALAEAARAMLCELAGSLRHMRAPTGFVSLRPFQVALSKALPDGGPIVEVADSVVDVLGTLAGVLD